MSSPRQRLMSALAGSSPRRHGLLGRGVAIVLNRGNGRSVAAAVRGSKIAPGSCPAGRNCERIRHQLHAGRRPSGGARRRANHLAASHCNTTAGPRTTLGSPNNKYELRIQSRLWRTQGPASQDCTSGRKLSGWAVTGAGRATPFGTASPLLRQDIAYSAHIIIGTRMSTHSSMPKLDGSGLLSSTE
jgi:hypothetical protein